MFLCVLVLAFFATTSPSFAAVAKNEQSGCSIDEFECADGACVSVDHVCDGRQQCADGSDESACAGLFADLDRKPFRNTIITRSKRQTEQCRRNQWKCRDGTCIPFDGKCDGMVDCPDKSDETHALCRKLQCQSNWFRCTYGACVDGTAPCNGVEECADGSDELLPRCRNETEEIRNKFTCANGQEISAAEHCDGAVDCEDGSDETIRTCASKTCPSYLFQCAYGACVDQGADCNGIQECADGSDEADELCGRVTSTTTKPPRPSPNARCILPPYPDHGRYTVGGVPHASPGQAFESVQVNFTCSPGYGIVGESSRICINGTWFDGFPECVRFCQLRPHPSVEYRCVIRGDEVEGTRLCNAQEPHGTTAKATCRAPNYYAPSGYLSNMHCIDGSWDYIAICNPECGRTTPAGEQLVIGGRLAERGELPWHAGIYRKTSNPYKQICGGTLVSNTVVISAAHCFWSDTEKQLPAANYAVALGKLYRPWNEPMDKDAQKSDVSDIKMPARFQGAATNFQEDIAIVVLTTVIEYRTYVRPICLNFDIEFERRQLKKDKVGKVAGWGLTGEDGGASPILKVTDLPYLEIGDCIAASPPSFREYVTSDKICAGFNKNDTALCKGDSGGGLAFSEPERGVDRFYLRGVVSTAPTNQHACNAFTFTTFTQVTKHEHFIKEYVSL